MTEGIEIANFKNIRTLGEKETYKYLGILEANTIKQVEMKEKWKRNTSGEQYLRRTNYVAEISSKGQTLGFSHS